MYYLKYRPRTIEELDNSNARDIIKNTLSAKEIPHAYLFIGQKGTGKTSTARIFAKAVNCLNNKFAGKGYSVEPCNECANCKSIEISSSPDIIELDAASNRGIEEIKGLIREAAFSPLITRYRVFIIDEAHMITNDAFNALLKTLEEPLSSVIFILATTNEEKVPKTITSRCFRINFGTAKKDDIRKMIGRITKNEDLKIEENLVNLIASHSEKSFRDTSKLLEELVIQNKLTFEEAQKYLGVRSKGTLLDMIQTRPLSESLEWINDFSQSGGSVKNLIEDLLNELQSALLAKNGINTDEEVSVDLKNNEITGLMRQLQDAYGMLRSAPIESIPLEIAVVEFYNQRGK